MSDASGHIITGLKQAMKRYSVYDTSDRQTDVYEVHTEAVHGTPCLRTQLVYDGVSSRVLKEKESVSSWNSTWDI